jgi:hypothetical protein
MKFLQSDYRKQSGYERDEEREERIPKQHDLDAWSVTCIADCGCERLKKILERKL